MQEINLPVSVLMERRKLNHRFVDESWTAVAVEAGRHEGIALQTETVLRYWVPDLHLDLRAGEAHGYLQNVCAESPKIFVLWRHQDGRAQPVLLSASYDEGARMLDSGETVDAVPLSDSLAGWVNLFARHPKGRLPEKRHGRRD